MGGLPASGATSYRRGSTTLQGRKPCSRGGFFPFDAASALIWALLMVEGSRGGQPRRALDTIIAATAEAHACRIVTDNERHFVGQEPINPLRGAEAADV